MASWKWLIPGALSALVLPLASASAQFNAIYGPTTGNDHGRAVHQLANGPLAGNFISVGEGPQPTAPAQSDVYVVITNGAGARINEYRIDIANGNDYGKDFVEKANGNIVITGFFNAAAVATTDIFALEFNPATGAVVWANDYSGSTPTGNNTDEAYDIEVATDGEFIIAGRSNSNHANHMDAILMKIDQNGAWRWGTAYDGASTDEGFYSVTSIGDGTLVASGHTNVGGNVDVFVARTNGFGNTISAARYGGAGNDGSRSVKVCNQLGPNPNRVVIAGNAGGVNSSLLMLVDYTTMNLIGANTYKMAGAGWTEAMGVVETPAPEYKFVMTGLTFDPQGNGRNYEFYLSRVTANLGVVDWYRTHGGVLDDRGWGVDLATPIGADQYSIIATGLRSTNALAQQLDITRTTQAGVMPCDVPLAPPVTPFNATRTLFTNCQQLWGMLLSPVSPRVNTVTSTVVLCPDIFFTIKQDEPAQSAERAADGDYYGIVGKGEPSQTLIAGTGKSADREFQANAFPNPVKRGTTFTLRYTLPGDEKMELAVSDMAGATIYQSAGDGTAGEHTVGVSTIGWTSGTYLLRMTIGERTITRKIIVSD